MYLKVIPVLCYVYTALILIGSYYNPNEVQNESRDYTWDPITERTISCVQILEVLIQCVVVDVHIDQALQKKNNLKSNKNVSMYFIQT